ncbi:unnamed protein product [Zymoseptoria tritici ST99CH_3D7]|uniref:Uncharacterized protein n=1 Tax=Zymoseptoria tritici (strain ST99CH_3D7) TaxID=1276538 RepID=A0A1X7RFZ3_ZYMT9|nr:unnamed protein product [Zymoseptoria tritici ST99CH_3D7]
MKNKRSDSSDLRELSSLTSPQFRTTPPVSSRAAWSGLVFSMSISPPPISPTLFLLLHDNIAHDLLFSRYAPLPKLFVSPHHPFSSYQFPSTPTLGPPQRPTSCSTTPDDVTDTSTCLCLMEPL